MTNLGRGVGEMVGFGWFSGVGGRLMCTERGWICGSVGGAGRG